MVDFDLVTTEISAVLSYCSVVPEREMKLIAKHHVLCHLGDVEDLSRPDRKNKWSPSSTFKCDGDESETLGSDTHPLVGRSLASIFSCRGVEAHYLMCGSVTTSKELLFNELADCELYGVQLRLSSIAAEDGCCREGNAPMCVPETTITKLFCNLYRLAD